MSGRFIPDSDYEFQDMALAFAAGIAEGRERFAVSEREVELLARAVNAFKEAFFAAKNPATRGPQATIVKDLRRQDAEVLIRRLGRMIRANDRICSSDKVLVGIRERSTTLTKGECPIYPPVVTFEGILAEGDGALHQLRVEPGKDATGKRSREGAVRMELFVDLVAPGETVPAYPGEFLSGRPWYLGSFTKSPIRVKPPIPPVPMLVVYWVRWADSSCRVGPWSKTCESRWEGRRVASQPTLGAMPEVRTLENDPKQITVITQFQQRYLEMGRVEQRMLEDARPAEEGRRFRMRLENSGQKG